MVRFCFLYDKTITESQNISKIYFSTFITLLPTHLLLLEKPVESQVEIEGDMTNKEMKCFITFDKTEEEIQQLVTDNKLKYNFSDNKCTYEEESEIKEFQVYGDIIKIEKTIQNYYKEDYNMKPGYYYDYDNLAFVPKES